MALFPPSIGLSENLDLAKCEEMWMHNYINGTIIPPPDDTELEESIYEEVGIDSLLEELKAHYNSFKGLNLLAIYPTYIAEINMGFVSRICDLSIDVVELVKSHKGEIAELTIRTVLESFIFFSWLLKRSDHKLHERFRDFSVGKEKLFSEKLVKKVDEKTPFDEQSAKKIASDAIQKSGLNPIEVSTERGDAFDLNIAQMAEEVWGADNEYYFLYKRLSDVTHGSWRVIAKYHLTQSLNPMQNGLYWYAANENKFAGLTPAFFGITVCLKSMISICNQIDHEITNEMAKELEKFDSKVLTKYLEYYKKIYYQKKNNASSQSSSQP